MLQSPTLRQPSDRAALYAWHADALDALAQGRKDNLKELAAVAPDLMPPISEDAPQCGYFLAKVARFALLVPAKIFVLSVIGDDGELLEPERVVCEIGGERYPEVETAWLRLCTRPISASEYQYRMALRDWAQAAAPNQPQAPRQDGKAVDWMTVKIELPRVPESPITPKRKRNTT